ncbi:Ca2+-binding protein, RTX toxin-related [Nostoc flagelliforme CCNUN1]|uniref:Ca2+-binding protein, RTX toxin-related n=1 Tax=Nostoc flagelliforme CCNUN1 TaxID=2038116 RepID=A0A2K8SL17_9NOSO|nr:Ca2+-binding protein, RTX toxin-related [Nostoc flagelliforme CCNUN1]
MENNEVADVTVNLDYIDGLNPSELKNVVPIANNIKDYLTNYPNNPNDLFEVINRNLTEELLSDDNLGLSEVLDSLSVNLDVSPKVIPFQFDNTNTRTSDGDINDIVLFQLKDIQLDVTNRENADVTITLDYINGVDPSDFKEVGLIADQVKDYLTNYPNNPNDFFEVINRNLTEELLTDVNLGLSEVLDSLSVNLDVAPAIIPFQFDSTNTRTPNGNINDIISFRLEDVTSPIDGGIVADVTVNLDYVDGIDSSVFKDVIPIGNYIKDFLANYPVEAGLYEVLNRDLTQGLLNDSNIGLSGVLDSLSVNLDVSPKIIPFQFDTTITRTANGDINDIVSFELEDILLPIDGTSVADVAVNLDYIDGIDPSAFKDVIPLGNFIEDYLTNYSHPNDSFEVVNNNLGNALLTDSNLGLSSVLDSLTVTLGASPGVIPFQFNNTVILTPIGTTIFGGSKFTQFCDIDGIVSVSRHN